MELSLDAKGEHLRWTLYKGGSQPAMPTPPPELVFTFCRFADDDVSPKRILEFAQRWGVLGPTTARRFGLVTAPAGKRGSEPIWLWRRAAAKTVALARLSQELRDGRRGDRADWAVATEDTAINADDDISMPDRRQQLVDLLDDWLGLANERLRIDWTRINPVVQLEAVGELTHLIGALAFQLILAITSEKGVAVCMECDMPYLPTRVPAAGREHFCDDCGKAASWRRSKRRQRADQNAKEKME